MNNIKKNYGGKRPLIVYNNSKMYAVRSWITCDFEDCTPPRFTFSMSSALGSVVCNTCRVKCVDAQNAKKYLLTLYWPGGLINIVKELMQLIRYSYRGSEHDIDYIFEYYLEKDIALEESVIKFINFVRVNNVEIDRRLLY